MAEPSLERLSRFTPDAGTLDRDALLFAAGRRSARPNRAWMALATVLAGTQALSLALLRPHPTPPPVGGPRPVARVAAPGTTVGPATPEVLADSARWSARHRLRGAATETRPAGDFTLIETGPPLRAFPRPRSLLN